MLTTQKPVFGRQGLEKNQVYSKMEAREGCHPWCPVLGVLGAKGTFMGGKEEWGREVGSLSPPGGGEGGVSLSPLF